MRPSRREYVASSHLSRMSRKTHIVRPKRHRQRNAAMPHNAPTRMLRSLCKVLYKQEAMLSLSRRRLVSTRMDRHRYARLLRTPVLRLHCMYHNVRNERPTRHPIRIVCRRHNERRHNYPLDRVQDSPIQGVFQACGKPFALAGIMRDMCVHRYHRRLQLVDRLLRIHSVPDHLLPHSAVRYHKIHQHTIQHKQHMALRLRALCRKISCHCRDPLGSRRRERAMHLRNTQPDLLLMPSLSCNVRRGPFQSSRSQLLPGVLT